MTTHRVARITLTGLSLAALTDAVMDDGKLARLEREMLRAPSPAPEGWRIVTRAGEGPALIGLAISSAVIATVRRRSAARPLVTIATGVVARRALAVRVDRQRPPKSWWQVTPDGPSYPSRHVTWFCLGATAVAAELPPSASGTAWSAVAASTAVIAYSRVRLGVHWPSDTIAGALVGVAVHLITEPRNSIGVSAR